jgi:hypothetical protein
VPAAPAVPAPAPTLEDVAALGRDADFSRFMQRDVDETVRRGALKKLFSDPHFNRMDGLDIYIDDYNKFEPLPEAMLAMLEHAKSVLNPPAREEEGDAEPSAAGEAAPPQEAADDAPAEAKAPLVDGGDQQTDPPAQAATDTAPDDGNAI